MEATAILYRDKFLWLSFSVVLIEAPLVVVGALVR